MKKYLSKMVVALVVGAGAALLSGFEAPPARLVVFVGVAAVAFFAVPGPKEKL